MRRNIVRIFAPIALAISLHAQTTPSVVPISKEGHHHLVLDNDYVRVYSVEVAPHSETLYHQHDLDYIFVTLGDSDVDSVRVGEAPVHLLLKDGEVRFTKGGFAHKAVNNSDKPFKNVTIELKGPQQQPKSCEQCSAKVWKTDKSDRPACTEVTLFETDEFRVSYWHLTNLFNAGPRVALKDNLLVGLNKFSLGTAATGMGPHHRNYLTYRQGTVRWNDKESVWHRYYWKADDGDADFVTIELRE